MKPLRGFRDHVGTNASGAHFGSAHASGRLEDLDFLEVGQRNLLGAVMRMADVVPF